MAGLKRMIATLIGVAILAFVICNVQFGIVAPYAIDGAPNSKIDVVKLTEPHCEFAEISANIEESGQSYCLGNAGDWDGADFIMLIEGLVLTFAGRFRGFRASKGTPSKRLRKIIMVSGGILFLLAILDRLELLPSAANSEGLAELLPFDISPWMLQICIAILGAMMLRGSKHWESEAEQSTKDSVEKRRVVADKFRSTFRQQPVYGNGVEQGRSRNSILLNRDQELVMSRSRGAVKVYATCPYCVGAGCTKCANKGTL